MHLRTKIYSLLSVVVVLIFSAGLSSCQQSQQTAHANKFFYSESKDAFLISILPHSFEKVQYRIVEETIMLTHDIDSTRQDFYFDFNIIKEEDNYLLQPFDLHLEILKSDGTKYEFGNNDKELTSLVKDLESFTDHSLEIYANEDGKIKYFIDKNKVTNEEIKVNAFGNSHKELFLTAIMPFFEFLPQQHVKIGQTWKNKGDVRLMGYSFERNSTFTLVSVDDMGIATILEYATLTTNPVSDQKSSQDFNMTLKLKGSIEAYFIVNLNESMLQAGNSNLNIEGHIETASESLPIKIHGKGRIINKN